MKKLILTFSFLVLLFGTLQASVSIIPMPQKCIEKRGNFTVNDKTVITLSVDNEEMRNAVSFWNDLFDMAAGFLEVSSTPRSSNVICCRLNTALPNEESYKLTVSSSSIHIDAKTPKGIFYAFQTLRQLLPSAIESDKQVVEKIKWNIPCVVIEDSPAFSYRGVMLDVSRHFIPKEDVKRHIDLLAFHKLNILHWHLTDDQGWRIEIKKYPKLTEIGSYRKETITAPGSNEYDGVPVSGFYTQEEAKEIVRYAAERFITVIPEIDMPGHMMAALASYPELGCTGGPYEIPTRFGVFNEVLCGGNEQTLQFAKDVLNEIMDIFPSEYIHIGGDECPKVRWRECPKCQAKIRELGLKSTPEHTKENQLQAYFMGEVEKVINARGRKMMGWDEILEGNPTKTSTVMAWTSPKAGIKSAQLQHKTIICPITHLYFSNPGYNRLKGVASVERVYNFEPVSDVLTPEEQKNIIGAQGCIWTEWTKDSVKMEWQMMPRIAALSELQWTQPVKKNLDSFLKRLPHQLDIYRLYGYHYREDIEEAAIEISPVSEEGKALVTLKTFDNALIYYTTDGTVPTTASLRYDMPFTVNQNTCIKAVVVRGNRISDVVEEKVQTVSEK